MADQTDRPVLVMRAALVALLAWHSCAWMSDPALGPSDGTWLLHGVSLAMHEPGHLLFSPFGVAATALGGSLLQVLLPLAFVVAFVRRRAWFAAAVCGWWVAQNVWDVAVYVADARAEALPLVGGGEHDWAFLLMRWHLLDADHAIARALSQGASVVAILSLGLAAAVALRALAPAVAPNGSQDPAGAARDA